MSGFFSIWAVGHFGGGDVMDLGFFNTIVDAGVVVMGQDGCGEEKEE